MTFPLASLRAAGTGLVLAAGLAGSAAAQSGDVQELISRVDRLQRELSTLQRQVYRGDAPPPAAAVPGQRTTVSPSDQSALSRLDVRLSQLEGELRSLTGRVEELSYAQSQVSGRLDKALQDHEFRIGKLEQGGPAAAAPSSEPPQGQPGQARQTASAPPPANPNLGAPPRDLGTVPADRVTSVPPQTGGDAARPPPPAAASPQEQYDYAMALLTRDQNLPEAEKALRTFIDNNPTSPQVSNAQYWLGETYFARKDYQQAASTFAEGYKKYPKSAKAPDTLLKLGMSLGHLNKRKEACSVYSRLLESHPTASAAIKGRAQREQKTLNCSA